MRALCKLLDPIMDILQMVDSDTRQIGKILRRYDEMIVCCLSACAILEKDEQEAVLEVFDRRRTMFKSPAHVAAMMLDPEFRERTMPDDEEMQHGLKLALVQFGYPEHSDQHNEVLTAIDKFHSREPLRVEGEEDGDNDFDDHHPDVDDDGGVRGDDCGDGGDRSQPRSTQRDTDREPDEGAGHCHDDGDADARSGARASDMQMVTPCVALRQEASTTQHRMTLEMERTMMVHDLSRAVT
ncbi:hypothetical protein CBR_g4312 [Chara braunii]|uniref:Uncharacterized protein n=1 Tax=Chara braunii TaxID=69332 RepID=A0A388JRD3_CHABU|nr:hypothetical protein CBR_g4312 [Chara braunii]|eukprot:GBG60355.1 hypothetical protein CBR_g4312 [Chara braunii]